MSGEEKVAFFNNESAHLHFQDCIDSLVQIINSVNKAFTAHEPWSTKQ